MRKMMALILSCLTFSVAFAYTFDDIQNHPACRHCGMDREKFGHSRMLVEYDDGTKVGTCSIHCTAVELALSLDKTPVAIKGGSFASKKLIDSEKATWVVGGNKPGAMTKRAKWAFESMEDAERFVRGHGGAIASFEEAMAAAYEDMYGDTKMIREKRTLTRMKMQQPLAK